MNVHRKVIECGGYKPGHPWYYVLGGRVLPPRAILESVQAVGHRGYLAADIDKFDNLHEPKRSQAMRARVRQSYRSNLLRYRELARKLDEERASVMNEKELRGTDLHSGVSLKHNHLFNDLAHLAELDRLIKR